MSITISESTSRAARLAFVTAVAHVWQQASTVEETIAQIEQIIEIDGGLRALRDAVKALLAECKDGKVPSQATIDAARKAAGEWLEGQ